MIFFSGLVDQYYDDPSFEKIDSGQSTQKTPLATGMVWPGRWKSNGRKKKLVEKMVQNIQSIDLYKKRFPSINQVQFKGVSQNNAKTFATSTMSVFL